MIAFQTAAINPRNVEEAVAHARAGAICTFSGVVRSENLGRTVSYLEYEAFEEMALPSLADIAERAQTQWPGVRVAIVHRLGRLDIGEASVVISASHPHRADAFSACRFVIDALKTEVPIWKKEVWSDGSHWVDGIAPHPLTAP